MSDRAAGDRAKTWAAPAAVAAWALLIAIAWVWGNHLNATMSESMFVEAPPLTGAYALRVEPWALLALVAGIVGVIWLPRLAEALSFKGLLVVAAVASGLWVVALAVTEGPSAISGPLGNPLDTFADLPRVMSEGGFLANFVDRIGGYTSHSRGHPPGMLLMLWGMDGVGLGGAGWAATVELAGGALVAPAVLVAMREVASERLARDAFAFMVLAPAAVFMSTTADALFAGVAAWAVALLVLATGRTGSARTWLALGGGTLAAWCLFLSYGLVLIAIIPIVVAVNRRDWRTPAIAAIPVVVLALAFALAGFWWLDGLAATREQYLLGISRNRPYSYFVFANLAALAVAAGPAVAAGLTRLRDKGAWLLVGGALGAIVVADASGMSKAEVERIWLPFTVWLFVACAPLSRSPRARLWLGAQAGFTLLIQLLVRN